MSFGFEHNLNRRGLTEIQNQMFSGMGGMTVLLINTNSITSLPSNAFSGLTQLTKIDANLNQIEELVDGLFSSNPRLHTIAFYSNRLKIIGYYVFEGLPLLHHVELRLNICIDSLYEAGEGPNRLRHDTRMYCKKPIPTTTTQSPSEIQRFLNEEKFSNLEKTVAQLNYNLAASQDKHQNELNESKNKLINFKDEMERKFESANKQLSDKDILVKELKANQKKNRHELNRAKIDLDQLQDEYYDSILKSLDDNFKQELKFDALERKFNASNCSTI